MKHVLVTGGGGFVGRCLCPVLARAGMRVAVAARTAQAVAGLEGVEVRPLPDIGPHTDWSEALKGIEAVVHLAARAHVMSEGAADPEAEYRHVNALGTRRLAESACAAGVRRLVFMSTVKVNGERSGGKPFTEDDRPAPEDAYGRSKMEAEEALAEVAAADGLETVILRPPLVYGPRVKGNFLSLLKICRRALPLPLAAVANRRSLIYVGNLADAVARCLSRPEAAGRTYMLGDGEDVSMPELIRRLAAALDRPARLFPVPVSVLRAAGRLCGRSSTVTRVLDTLTVDDRRIRRDLDWTPPFTMAHGLEETAAWFLSRHQ